jgi:predicted nucleotidyltransferase
MNIYPSPKPKSTSRATREEALHSWIHEAQKYGVVRAWLVGSMADDTDGPFSDIDILIDRFKGSIKIKSLYGLRDRIYRDTGVIIKMTLEPPKEGYPKVKIIGN